MQLVKKLLSVISFTSSSYQHSWAAHHDTSPVRGCVAHAGRWFTANQHRSRPHYNDIRRPHAGTHIAYCGGWLPANQDGGHTGSYNGPTHVRNGHYGGGLHGANVHIHQSGCWLWHSVSFFLLVLLTFTSFCVQLIFLPTITYDSRACTERRVGWRSSGRQT